jgi:hypothetical protein
VSHRGCDQHRYRPASTWRSAETVFKTVAFVRSATLGNFPGDMAECSRTRATMFSVVSVAFRGKGERPHDSPESHMLAA